MHTPTIDDIVAARKTVAAHLRPTPLHRYPGLCDLVGTEVWIKHENHHAVGAFKVRGGVHLASTLGNGGGPAAVITASTGNHGQSIALGGVVSNTPVTVAVPHGANPSKVAAMRALGAEVVSHGRDFDEAREWAMSQARERNARFIGPTEPELIEGVGTYALEILDDAPDVEVVIVPVGGGSGAAATGIVMHAANPEIEVIGVQAEAAPAAYLSWREGEPVEAPMRTEAEGLATRVPFANTQALLRQHLSDFVLVSEAAMRAAVRSYLEHAHTVAELAGAASLAAACQLRDRLAGRKVVLVLSGGNISLDGLRGILHEGWLAQPGAAT